jgi:hypothetical protein
LRRSLIFLYIPEGRVKMSHWYDAMSFDGAKREIASNLDGGPCGTTQFIPIGPH